MSGQYNDYSKGSSRSTRDDSRQYKESHSSRDRRSRSRSPRRRSPNRSSEYELERSFSNRDRDRKNREVKGDRYPSDRPTNRYRDNRDYEGKSHSKSSNWEDEEEEEVPAPPPPPRITKISIGFTKPKAPIKMSLGGPAKPAPKPTIASVFGADDDDDDAPEEMPAEARMRMRNIGRETPTSAGPNSFGKTKQGFCDAKKVFEKTLKEALESNEKPKLPQTIYRIKGP